MKKKLDDIVEGEIVGDAKKSSGRSNKFDNDERRNWERLADVLQNKSNNRLASTEYLIGRASLVIAAVAFLVPSVLGQDMPMCVFVIVSASIIASLTLMMISIFTAPLVPIDPRGMIDRFKEENAGEEKMPAEAFDEWLSNSYRDGLEGYDKNYAKNRKLQKWSIGLLIFAILLLFFNKGVDMVSIRKQREIPDSSTTYEKRSFESQKPSSFKSRKGGIPDSSVTTCLNERGLDSCD